ncbi:MAG TPA: RidA family protein [Solirubrobacteraceae bacterium]|jgi:enamine deaminase RidA (YjgF/YER057c/UK114 family)|nr:RidA family protein [Solirubrobacteraceae bacterium]
MLGHDGGRSHGMKVTRNPPDIHAPLAGYSHQIELSRAERLLALSGQVGMTASGEVPEQADDQFELALANIARNLDAAGMTAADLIKLTFYLTEPIAPARRAELLAAVLRGHAPTMTLIYVPALAGPTLKVEIDAWASTDRPG